MRRECEATVTVAAAPEAVWSVISDVTRVGEWSGESVGCEWVGQPGEAVPGARFRGTNHRRGMRWTRLNEIDRAVPGAELVWHTIFAGRYRDSTEWRVHLRPVADETEVTLSFQILRLSRAMEWILGRLQPAHNDRTADLADDLARLKALVESASVSR